MFFVQRRFRSLPVVLLLTCGTLLAADSSVFNVKTQRRVKMDGSANQFRVVQESQQWDAAKTAIIIIDMWDAHQCISAARRVDEILKKNVVLCRDLTDSYHRDPGHHFEGLNTIIAHVEKYWCPTITSDNLTGQTPFRFKQAEN